ncbi:hypothetical protein VTO42DRAFT_8948 [Malbranchea cinnamomea]
MDLSKVLSRWPSGDQGKENLIELGSKPGMEEIKPMGPDSIADVNLQHGVSRVVNRRSWIRAQSSQRDGWKTSATRVSR